MISKGDPQCPPGDGEDSARYLHPKTSIGSASENCQEEVLSTSELPHPPPPTQSRKKNRSNLNNASSRKRSPLSGIPPSPSPAMPMYPPPQLSHNMHVAHDFVGEPWQHQVFSPPSHHNIHSATSEEKLHSHSFMNPPPSHHPPLSSSPPNHLMAMPYWDYYRGNNTSSGSLPLHLSGGILHHPHHPQIPPPQMFDPMFGMTSSSAGNNTGETGGKVSTLSADSGHFMSSMADPAASGIGINAPIPAHLMALHHHHHLSGPSSNSPPPPAAAPGMHFVSPMVGAGGPAMSPTSALFVESAAGNPFYNYNPLVAQPGSCDPGPPLYFYVGTKRGPQGANLFVFHIPDDFTNRDMCDLFGPFGTLASVRIMTENSSNRNLGYGFVSYLRPEDAEKAISELNGFMIKNKRLKVQHKQKQMKSGKHGRRQRHTCQLPKEASTELISTPLDDTSFCREARGATLRQKGYQGNNPPLEHRTATLSAVAHLAPSSIDGDMKVAIGPPPPSLFSDTLEVDIGGEVQQMRRRERVKPNSSCSTGPDVSASRGNTGAEIDLKEIGDALKGLAFSKG
mmetsp:Transcript_13198/g.26337  ORF Transcript_13198/g.26337 Transcript_13198/m.26337 type:complete len:566 (+) Transcript_13198:130-1827(+)|eukprot:CAMPEP_0194328056 /NCGR_PEP_ID=MMETSP0171-20130528/43361_1 /TAXON_ID=218684 /ORGANISM="Corethron pennatum, Strain L29A3" /LENGTH=565 /DNA_ID=CAMNT_0039088247 /DNA_START=121 /DNA_END=1818 /DNA_ORIENTATION=-